MALRVVLSIAATLALIALPRPVTVAGAGPSVAPPPAASSLVTDAVPVPLGSPTEPLAPGTALRLAVTVPFRNASRLNTLLEAVTDPRSAAYRQFLSYAAFSAEFDPASSSIEGVEQAFRAAGASSVLVAPGGFTIDATMAAGAVEALLGVRLVEFAVSGAGTEYTAIGSPTLPAPLVGEVVGIDGLAGENARPSLETTLGASSPPAPVRGGPAEYLQGNGTGGADWFLGSDYAQAYEATELLPGNRSVANATYPLGVAIATLLASGFNASSATALPPWTPSVVDDYFNDTFPSTWPHPTVVGVPVDESGAPPPPLPGSFSGLNDSTGFTFENALDLEMAGSLAPGSSLYNFYFSGSLVENPTTWPNVPEYLADDLGAALSYSYGPAHLAVVTCSFGLDDLNDSQWDADLEVAAMTGVTVVAASGDQGNAPNVLTGRGDNPWPLWPATAAFGTSGAISVGGTTVALSGIPTGTYTSPPLVARYDPKVEGIANASAWWDTSRGIGGFVGTEGGTSLTYPEPSWQFHSAAQPAIVNTTETERFSQLGRAGPDVAFPANSTIAFVSSEPNGTPVFAVLEGTSISAPVFAGLLADVVAVENATRGDVHGLGFLDPELYRIASYYQVNPGSSDPFLSVPYGENELFSATPGWDPLTGWGGLSAPLFLDADQNATVADYVYTGPTPTLPPAPSPATPVLTVLIVFAGAAAVVVVASFVLSGRRRRRVRALRRVAGYGQPQPSPAEGRPPGAPVATFSCPYCGFDRPAEPGRCPGCGAM